MLVCPLQPDSFQAVGLWYEDFGPTTDSEVRAAMPAEGRITEPSARVAAGIEKQLGEPLSDEQKQAIAHADEERRSALAAARAAAKNK